MRAQSTDHPYANIIVAVLEGRMSAATGQMHEALDGAPADGGIEAGLAAGVAQREHAGSATSEDMGSIAAESPPQALHGGGGAGGGAGVGLGRAISFEDKA